MPVVVGFVPVLIVVPVRVSAVVGIEMAVVPLIDIPPAVFPPVRNGPLQKSCCGFTKMPCVAMLFPEAPLEAAVTTMVFPTPVVPVTLTFAPGVAQPAFVPLPLMAP